MSKQNLFTTPKPYTWNDGCGLVIEPHSSAPERYVTAEELAGMEIKPLAKRCRELEALEREARKAIKAAATASAPEAERIELLYRWCGLSGALDQLRARLAQLRVPNGPDRVTAKDMSPEELGAWIRKRTEAAGGTLPAHWT